MKISKHPFGYNFKAIYPEVKEGKYYLIIDESTLADFLGEDDKALLDQLVKVIEFKRRSRIKQLFRET